MYMFSFSHGGNRNQQEGCVTDVDSGSFICDIGTLMWLSGTLMLAFNTFFKKKKYDRIVSRPFVRIASYCVVESLLGCPSA